MKKSNMKETYEERVKRCEKVIEKAVDFGNGILIANVPKDLLVIEHKYQRDVDGKRASQMAKNWDNDICGVLYVVYDPIHACFHLWDGEHRYESGTFAGLDYFTCIICLGKTLAQEASLFIRANTGSKKLRPDEVFRANLIASENDAKLNRCQRNYIILDKKINTIHKKLGNITVDYKARGTFEYCGGSITEQRRIVAGKHMTITPNMVLKDKEMEIGEIRLYYTLKTIGDSEINRVLRYKGYKSDIVYAIGFALDEFKDKISISNASDRLIEFLLETGSNYFTYVANKYDIDVELSNDTAKRTSIKHYFRDIANGDISYKNVVNIKIVA